jgi:hypothetical protein
MFKKNDNKPFQVKGIIQSVQKGEEHKGAYLGNDNYNVYTLKINDKEYLCNVSVNEKFEFKEGDDIFFRAKKHDKFVQIDKKSLGFNIAIPQDAQFTLSDDMLRKLKERNDAIKEDDKQAIIKSSTTRMKI